MTGASPAEAPGKQPRGLYVLFLAEMWERFSYYGMRGLLVLYLVNAMHMSNADAQSMYGVYTGLVYVTPLIGGYLADKFLGARLASVIGGSVMMLGHFAMAVPSMLYVALGLLIVGNGFFKPNTSSMVGMLYPSRQDPRIDSGYTIFYMGINLGAFIANLVSGTLGEKIGYHWGFASAGVCMGLGLISFLALQRHLGKAGLRDDQGTIGWRHAPTIAAWSAGCVVAVYAAIQAWGVVGPLVSGIPPILRVGLAIALLAGAVTLFNAFRKDKSKDTRPLTRAERGRVFAVGVMVLFVVFFWMGFEQAGGSMNLFAAQKTDRVFFGWEMPATWFQSLNPLFIITLAPVFALVWNRMEGTRFALSDVAKQGWGIIVVGIGFMVMLTADEHARSGVLVSSAWLFFVYLLHTIGELMLSPVGLAMVARVAPERLASALMGAWFLSSGLANYLAGDLENLLTPYHINPYKFLIWSSLIAGTVLLLMAPWLSRLLGRWDAEDAPTGPQQTLQPA